MARTIGTATPLRHPVVKPSFMKRWWCKGHGHCKVQMHGIWVPPKTITDATYINAYRISGSAELFPQHCQVPNLSNIAHLIALTEELETAASLMVKAHKGRTFIRKLKIAINSIMNASGREEQRVSMPSAPAPQAMTSGELPIQQTTEVPPIMKAWDPTAKRNLINTKRTH
jgi:hypothetical protein